MLEVVEQLQSVILWLCSFIWLGKNRKLCFLSLGMSKQTTCSDAEADPCYRSSGASSDVSFLAH